MLWLVPLGSEIVHGRVPTAIAYAVAPTAGWHDVPAGGQVAVWALYRGLGGLRGLAIGQAAAAALGFGALAAGLRMQGASAIRVLANCGVVIIGSAAAVFVINASLFSLALFPVLVLLLQSESESPSRRVWLSVPLIALWGNLHGEVLVGFVVLACYLVLERTRREPLLAGAVLVASAAALFANAALWHTPRYYSGIFHSAVARRGVDLWAPLGTGALDLASIAAAVVLAGLCFLGRARVRRWEAVALVALAAETVHVARAAPWLLFLLAYPAARGARSARELRRRPVVLAAAILGAGAAVALAKGPVDPGARALAQHAAATHETVLAEPILGQQVALAGGRVWIDNPIDAFTEVDQATYLDWLAGKPRGDAALSHVALVLVKRSSTAGRRAAGNRRLLLLAADDRAALYRVRG